MKRTDLLFIALASLLVGGVLVFATRLFGVGDFLLEEIFFGIPLILFYSGIFLISIFIAWRYSGTQHQRLARGLFYSFGVLLILLHLLNLYEFFICEFTESPSTLCGLSSALAIFFLIIPADILMVIAGSFVLRDVADRFHRDIRKAWMAVLAFVFLVNLIGVSPLLVARVMHANEVRNFAVSTGQSEKSLIPEYLPDAIERNNRFFRTDKVPDSLEVIFACTSLDDYNVEVRSGQNLWAGSSLSVQYYFEVRNWPVEHNSSVYRWDGETIDVIPGVLGRAARKYKDCTYAAVRDGRRGCTEVGQEVFSDQSIYWNQGGGTYAVSANNRCDISYDELKRIAASIAGGE